MPIHKPVVLSFLVFLFLGLVVYASGAVAQERLVVNTGFTPPVSTFFHLVVDEAGRRLGIPVDFQEMPAERSLVLVSAGVDDAECCRIPTVMQQSYPDLINVPFSFFTARFSAFTRDKTITINNWQDLQPYTVGVVTGWKIVVQSVAKVQPKGYVVLDTPEAMFHMLEQGRIDIATLGYLSGLQVLFDYNLTDIQVLDPPLAEKPLYMQFNKKHRALVPRFAQVFAEMTADGTIARIEKTVFDGLQ